MSVRGIALIVDLLQDRITLNSQGLLYGGICRLIDRGVLPAGSHGQKRAAHGGALLSFGEIDIRAEDVCQHGLPNLTDRAAAAENGLINLDGTRLHAIAERIGYALQHGETHILAGGVHGQADERAPGVHVVMGTTLTRQVGQEIHAGLTVVGFGGVAVVGVQNIAYPPLVAGSGREDTAHEVEFSVSVSEVVEGGTALGVELVAGQEDGAAGAEGNTAIPIAEGVGTHSRPRVIPRTGTEDGVRQAVLGLQLARSLVAFKEGGEHIHGDAADLAHLGGPAFVLYIQKQHSCCVGVLGGEDPRQLVGEVVLGQADLLGLCEVLGLILLDPQDFGGGEAGEGDVPREGGEGAQTVEIGGLGGTPSVVPEDGGADDFVVFVQHDQTVHLACDAHALDRFFPAFGQDLEDLHGGLVPVSGILLAPVGIRGGDGVVDAVIREDGSVAVQKDTLAGRCAQINTNIVVHIRLPRREYR